MTWLDVTLIVALVIFIAVGARLGSLWTGACLIGGFAGGFLADYYTLPLSSAMGSFSGAETLAALLLFLCGAGVALLPGWVLSHLSSGLILGVADSVFGLATGALAGLVAVTLAFLLLLPHAPALEKSQAWRKSLLVRPLHHFIEDVFNDVHFQREPPTTQLKDVFIRDFSPVVKDAEKTIKTTTGKIVNKIHKKG